MKNFHCILFSIVVIHFAFPLSAQILIHHNKNVEDGLAFSQVLSIHEDQSGYLWLGTSSGLSCWDGVAFKNFGVSQGLNSADIQAICESREGELYFGTRQGIFRLIHDSAGDRFVLLPSVPDELRQHIEALFWSEDGILWIATAQTGIWNYDGIHYKQLFDERGQELEGTVCIAPGRGGVLYFGTALQGIQAYQNGKLHTVRLPHNTAVHDIRCLFEDESGRLFIGTEKGLFISIGNSITFLDEGSGLPGDFVNHIVQVPDGSVYVATSKGVAVFKGERLTRTLNEENGLSTEFVWCIDISRSGMIYFGTDGNGFDYFRPGVWTTLNKQTGLPHNTIWSILQAQDGSFFFSTEEGIVQYDQGRFKTWNTRSGLSENQVLCSFQGSDGALYFGNNYHGVDILQDNRFKNVSKKDGLTGEGVWTINEDADGRIYFGIYGGGICVMESSRIVSRLSTKDGLPSDFIVSSYHSPDGTLFFGTDGNGAVEIKNGKVQTTFLPGSTVWSFFKDSSGTLFFGTNENGLMFLKNQKWHSLTMNEGLSNNCVLGILQDDQGILYLTTDSGLNAVDFSGDTALIRKMSQKDGLAGNEFNQGAYLKDREGSLWFGSTKGVSCYRPWLDNPDRTPPRTYIKRIQLFGREIPLERMKTGPSFAYNQNLFQFDFIGINLSAPDKVTYRHRLDKIDADWVDSSSRNIQYTNLSPGTYNFEVKSANEWGSWSEPQGVRFTIAPPFWKTWWFLTLAFLVIVSLAWFLISMRVKRLLAIERLRAKIAADLHDDIGAGLSEISILSAVIETKSPDAFKHVISRELQKIGSLSRGLVESMSDIVWLVNPKNDSLYDLFTHLKDSFADVLEIQQIEFNSINLKQLEGIRLSMEFRQHVFLIFKEVIHNAVKYSACSRLELEIECQHRNLCIKLTDNGKGFDPSTVSKGNGLKNMQARARKVGADLIVKSEQGHGTKITFEGKTA